jgi:hypothetical protein
MKLVIAAGNFYDIAVHYTSPKIDIARRPVEFHEDPYTALHGSQRQELEDAEIKVSSPACDKIADAYARHNHPPHFDTAVGKLLRLVNAKLDSRVRPQLFLSPNGSGLEGHDEPVDLLGAMWQMLFDMICVNGDHRRCRACRNWFEVSPNDSRGDRQYCSDACRMRSYRQRKKSGTLVGGDG